eukprot:5221323-Karenia_brevis.AAC.1
MLQRLAHPSTPQGSKFGCECMEALNIEGPSESDAKGATGAQREVCPRHDILRQCCCCSSPQGTRAQLEDMQAGMLRA